AFEDHRNVEDLRRTYLSSTQTERYMLSLRKSKALC
ncbi:hypothetical protein L917_12930, partial [Phytophthora nicotianae]